MKVAKTPYNLKELPHPPQKKLLKRKNITTAETNAPISQTSSEHLKVTNQTYRIGNK